MNAVLNGKPVFYCIRWHAKVTYYHYKKKKDLTTTFTDILGDSPEGARQYVEHQKVKSRGKDVRLIEAIPQEIAWAYYPEEPDKPYLEREENKQLWNLINQSQ